MRTLEDHAARLQRLGPSRAPQRARRKAVERMRKVARIDARIAALEERLKEMPEADHVWLDRDHAAELAELQLRRGQMLLTLRTRHSDGSAVLDDFTHVLQLLLEGDPLVRRQLIDGVPIHDIRAH